jgi:hypothetical protein
MTDIDYTKIDRLMVVDHSSKANPVGINYSKEGIAIEPSVQDGGRTLKIFVGDKND